MKGLEKIFSGKKLIAIVYRKDIVVDGVKFLTSEENNFQIGLHSRQSGIKLPPHVHNVSKKIEINTLQELLYLVEGKIRVNLFDNKGKALKKKTLNSGDSILLISGGHGVDFLEDSRVFEVKQGPYLGAAHAKIYLK